MRHCSHLKQRKMSKLYYISRNKPTQTTRSIFSKMVGNRNFIKGYRLGQLLSFASKNWKKDLDCQERINLLEADSLDQSEDFCLLQNDEKSTITTICIAKLDLQARSSHKRIQGEKPGYTCYRIYSHCKFEEVQKDWFRFPCSKRVILQYQSSQSVQK